jgi:ATP adenylyltransferase
MDRLFSPWRSRYIESFHQPATAGAACVLCEAHAGDDDERHLVVARSGSCFALLNLYPYNSGHLMVVPYRHTGEFASLTHEELADVMVLLQRLSVALTGVLHPDGFNIGANLGRPAGAGIDQHVHFHIVPRWNGDTNFMPILADTKMISEDMHETWKKLRSALAAPSTA